MEPWGGSSLAPIRAIRAVNRAILGRTCGTYPYLPQYRTLKNYRNPEFLGPRLADKVISAIVLFSVYWGIGEEGDAEGRKRRRRGVPVHSYRCEGFYLEGSLLTPSGMAAAQLQLQSSAQGRIAPEPEPAPLHTPPPPPPARQATTSAPTTSPT